MPEEFDERIGEICEDATLGWKCHYSELPGDPMCLAEATWHGIVLNDPRFPHHVGMPGCDKHLALLVDIATHLHKFEYTCGMPESKFLVEHGRCEFSGWTVSELLGEIE